jgi:hypothetical protein
LLTIYSFEKETGELGPARDDSKEVDPYYKEREWRLVPLRSGVISGSVIFDEVGQAFYKFKRSDVHLVITPDQDTRKEVLKYFSSLEVEADGRLLEFYENPLPVIVYDDLKKW